MSVEKFITIFLLAVLLLFALFTWVTRKIPIPPPGKQISEKWVEGRMTYHGTNAICDMDSGKCWFYRDGVKYRL